MQTDHDNPGGIHAPAPGENATPNREATQQETDQAIERAAGREPLSPPIGDDVPGTNDYDRAVPMATDAMGDTGESQYSRNPNARRDHTFPTAHVVMELASPPVPTEAGNFQFPVKFICPEARINETLIALQGTLRELNSETLDAARGTLRAPQPPARSALCCHPQCAEPATLDIYNQPPPGALPSDYHTQACGAHVGYLLEDGGFVSQIRANEPKLAKEEAEAREIERAATLVMAALIYARSERSPSGAFNSARLFVNEARAQGYGAAEFLGYGAGEFLNMGSGII